MVVVSTFTAPDAGVLHHEPGCSLTVDEVGVGSGDLYITENSVVWASGQGAQCFTLDYPRIALHAVQRVPVPLIYMMLDYKLRLPGQPEPADTDDDDFDPEEEPTTDLRFVPQNEAALPLMYEAMNKGQALHPDEADDDAALGGALDELDEDFMLADTGVAPSQDAADRMEGLTIDHSNGNGHNAEDGDEDDDQFADA